MANSLIPRVIADARESLRALTLVEVPRLAFLEKALARRSQQAESGRQVLFITGEGGMGKSVALGQILDKFVAGESGFEGAAVLISCVQVTLNSTRPTRDDVDRALGHAVGDQAFRFKHGLFAGLQEMKTEHGSVTLLIDTLDLLLAPESLPGLADCIANALEVSDVIITCREDEYRSYLMDASRSAPRLARRIIQVTLPRLSGDEIISWARQYLDNPERQRTGEEDSFVEALQGGLQRSGSLRDVCSVAVRLALTCKVFASTGHLPEDLTVSDLYGAYWEDRVAKHTGVRSPAGDAKERAALAIASRVVTDSGTLRLLVPASALGPEFGPGLQLLRSEGILVELRSGWEFFHQTFAEYAHARWLLRQGLGTQETERLGTHLTEGRSNLWAVARFALLQVDTDTDYWTLVEHLPLTGPEGAKAHLVAALRQPDPHALATVLARISSDPVLWQAVLPDLGHAPRSMAAAGTAIIDALRQHARDVAGAATSALENLLPRMDALSASNLLISAIAALRAARPTLPDNVCDQYLVRLLRRLIGTPAAEPALEVVSEQYQSFGPGARRAAILLYLHSSPTQHQIGALARNALVVQCPTLADDEVIDLMGLFWANDEVRQERGWHTWRELITDDLPRGGWHNAKVKTVAHLSSRDETIREELATDVLDHSHTHTTAYVNALEQVAANCPQWMAERLLAAPPPTEAATLGAVSSAATSLAARIDSTTAVALIAWLTPGRSVLPRSVWPAQIILAGKSVPVHERLLEDLLSSGHSPQVLDSAIDAWIFHSADRVLDPLTPQLRLLLQSTSADVMQTRARLEGRLCVAETEARQWVTRVVLDGPSPRIAGTAIKTLEDRVTRTSAVLHSSTLEWLVRLVATQHTDAARRVLGLLISPETTPDGDLATIAPALTDSMVRRMDRAIERREDTQLVQAIIDLLIRIDRQRPLPPELVRHLYCGLVARLTATQPSSTEASAVLKNLGNLCGTLMASRLPKADIRALIEDLVSSLPLDAMANKSVRTVSSILVGINHRDNAALDWLEDLFWKPGAADGLRQAIAEAVLENDRWRTGGRATKIKDDPRCPPNVATYIVNNLRA